MTESDRNRGKLRLSTLSFEDWAWICFGLAAAGVAFGIIFHSLAWLAGWPGPFLWFGSENRLLDILTAAGSIGMVLFIFNVFASALLLSFFAIRRRLFRRHQD